MPAPARRAGFKAGPPAPITLGAAPHLPGDPMPDAVPTESPVIPDIVTTAGGMFTAPRLPMPIHDGPELAQALAGVDVDALLASIPMVPAEEWLAAKGMPVGAVPAPPTAGIDVQPADLPEGVTVTTQDGIELSKAEYMLYSMLETLIVRVEALTAAVNVVGQQQQWTTHQVGATMEKIGPMVDQFAAGGNPMKTIMGMMMGKRT